MHHRQLQLTLKGCALLLGLLGCGGGPTPGRGLAVAIHAADLTVGTRVLTSARIDLHTRDAGAGDRCTAIRLSGPSVAATYSTAVTLGGNDTGGQGDIEDILAGSYTVVVWGYAGGDTTKPRAFGCSATPVTIQDGQRATATISLRACTVANGALPCGN